MILGLAVAQDPNYHGRNYQQDDGQPQADSRRPTSTTPIPILHWNKQQEHDGTYKTRYIYIYNHTYFLYNLKKKDNSLNHYSAIFFDKNF